MTTKKTKHNNPAGNPTLPDEIIQKQKEKALRNSEEIFLQFMDNSPIYVFFKDENIRAIRLSRNYEKMLGRSIDELLGKNMYDLFPSDLAKSMVEDDMRILKEGKQINVEEELNGRFYSTIKFPIYIDGKPLYLAGFTIDITERKRAENDLRKSEEKYRLIFEYSPLGFLYFDENGIIADCNDNFVRIIGSSREKLIGLNMLDLPDKNIVRAVKKALNGSTAFYEDIYRSVTAEKSTPVRVIFTPLDIGEGNVLGGVGIIEDITERKRLKEEQLKADKLESVGVLAGGIAHDFNNILTAIIGNISLARMHVKPGSKAFELLSAAETASMRASVLTGQLLTFARGGMPVRETASVSRLIEELSLFVLQGSKSVCEFSIEEDLWPVEADVGQIRQAISNILINANQAMPEGGVIRILAENLVLEEGSEINVKPGRYVHVSIKDQGTGIAEKDLSKIFDPYFTTKNEGSGLGLAAAYSIIKKHNGHIAANSLLGAGTTFDIYLPASDKAIPKIKESDLLKGAGKILLMDDDRMLRELAEAMLEILGYESEFAEDGAEAIEMYRRAKESEKPYDAVIMDLTIPGGMGGKEAVEKMLELDPQLKAIVCSGYSDGPVMSNYREYGFKGKIAKPFDLNTLSKVLNEVLINQGSGSRGQGTGVDLRKLTTDNRQLAPDNGD